MYSQVFICILLLFVKSFKDQASQKILHQILMFEISYLSCDIGTIWYLKNVGSYWSKSISETKCLPRCSVYLYTPSSSADEESML